MSALIRNCFCFVVLFLVTCVKCELPDYIKVCPHDHKNLSACIIDSIENLRPYLKTGIKDIQVPALEPLELDDLKLDTLGGASRLATNLSEIKLWGASTFQILKLTPKQTKKGYNFRYEVKIPTLHIDGNYEIDSQILFVNLQGKGPFHINLTDYHFECILKGSKVQRNGANHLMFDDMECNAVLEGSSIFLENLFNGNPVLGKATNDVINDNSKALFTEIRPQLGASLRRRFTDIANKITLAFTYEELFP